jgi:hypothetical protein
MFILLASRQCAAEHVFLFLSFFISSSELTIPFLSHGSHGFARSRFYQTGIGTAAGVGGSGHSAVTVYTSSVKALS